MTNEDTSRRTLMVDEDMGAYETLRPILEFAMIMLGTEVSMKRRNTGDISTLVFTNGDQSMSVSMALTGELFDAQ